MGQAAANAGQALDGHLGLAGAAWGVFDEVVFEGLLMLVQFARLLWDGWRDDLTPRQAKIVEEITAPVIGEFYPPEAR